jgi:hypothetical protein
MEDNHPVSHSAKEVQNKKRRRRSKMPMLNDSKILPNVLIPGRNLFKLLKGVGEAGLGCC